ncbi:SDR family oxidoreductase [Nocardioides oleivorans]|uniref:SDR family oxidoreductase n=1 Tax=Nocardioides oleivorans TaxID=273676 RepID=A0A4Q2RRQ2_9ACTN|nr:SDR family oxidoreductase [Nocardioides oleivorans]RYB91670.1 SDR family oxidoreductase [Nocardioides oleivorans]
MSRFTDRVAIVTGGGSGIGAATARLLAMEGATVVIAGRRVEKLEEVAASVDGVIVPRKLDVTDRAAVTAAVDEVAAEHGRLDVLVNNAGIGPSGPADEVGDDDWDQMMATVLSGAFIASRAALPHLVQGGGNIVNVCSVSGIGGDWGGAAYNAAKGGLANLTRAMALDHAGDGVRVNAVAPTFTETEMTSGMGEDDDLMNRFMERLPMGRPAKPEEVAWAIAFLASHDASYVNGVVLPVDGGLSASNGQPRLG